MNSISCRARKILGVCIIPAIREINSVVRSALSLSARVDIDKQPEWISVRVRDYGKGVSPEIAGKVSSPGMGVGVTGMRERLRQFGGELIFRERNPAPWLKRKSRCSPGPSGEEGAGACCRWLPWRPERTNTMQQFLDHLANDVVPALLGQAFNGQKHQRLNVQERVRTQPFS